MFARLLVYLVVLVCSFFLCLVFLDRCCVSGLFFSSILCLAFVRLCVSVCLSVCLCHFLFLLLTCCLLACVFVFLVLCLCVGSLVSLLACLFVWILL